MLRTRSEEFTKASPLVKQKFFFFRKAIDLLEEK